ncbi:MAG: FAD/NAD(P)-binding protein [bacterium]
MTRVADAQQSTAERVNEHIYVPEPAVTLDVEPMAPLDTCFEFQLESGIHLGHMPGQFVQVSIQGIGEAPISIASSPDEGDTFRMLVRKVGNVTGAMHALEPGERIYVRGPFGHGFPVEEDMLEKDILFVGGGCGMAPLRSAITYTLDPRHREQYGRITILYGCKEPRERLFRDDLADFRDRDDITFLETVDQADEHWHGNSGVITTLIPGVDVDPERTVAVVCGPPAMYRFVIAELHKKGLDEESTFVSLERHMKCGVGKCGRCQINDIYCCQDGPVFRLSDIRNLPEAI